MFFLNIGNKQKKELNIFFSIYQSFSCLISKLKKTGKTAEVQKNSGVKKNWNSSYLIRFLRLLRFFFHVKYLL